MLNTPDEFPKVNSWCLYPRDGELVAARIIAAEDREGMVTLSFPDTPSASGTRQVDASWLVDATPLSPEERARFDHVCSHLVGLKLPGRSPRYAEMKALGDRERHARRLTEQLQRLSRFRTLGTPAVRAAHRHFAALIDPAQLRNAA